MKRAVSAILLLTVALVVALALRVRHLRAAEQGPAGGTGVIEGVDVNITSRLVTRIDQIHAQAGQFVKAGELLVELDCTEQLAALEQAEGQLGVAEANLDVARANVGTATRNASAARKNTKAAGSQVEVLRAQESLARIDLERTEELVKRGTLAPSALDEARSRHLGLASQIHGQLAIQSMIRSQADALFTTGGGAKSQERAAHHAIKLEQGAVTRAKVAVEECRLKSPRGGMVAARNLEPGELVQPGTDILLITDMTEARTRFYLPNEALASAAPGRKVRVVADAYPGQAFTGTIFYVSPRAEFTPRNVQTRRDRERLVYAVEVRIPNADLRLRSGMPVEVTIEGSPP